MQAKEWCAFRDFESKCNAKMKEREKRASWRNYVKDKAMQIMSEAEMFQIRNRRNVLVTKEDGLFTDVIIKNSNEFKTSNGSVTRLASPESRTPHQ